MRSLNYTDNDDIKALNAEDWQLELLKLNPNYTSWGPHEDYMIVEGEGWNSAMIYDTWKEFSQWKLDDLNECVNFYFSVNRASKDCSCGDGYHPAARVIKDSFYSHSSPDGIGWKDKITDDEYKKLVEAKRIDYKEINGEKILLTREEVNQENKKNGINSHDAINRSILIQARLERLGLPQLCPLCDGHAYVYVEHKAHVKLVLWMLHPRKGASRGVEIKRINQKELPEIYIYLNEAAQRNADRFSKIPTNL